MEDKLKEIITFYGVNAQLKHFHSEVFELIEAIMLSANTDFIDKKHITEEIADVMVMLKQFVLYYDIKDEDIGEMMEYKIDRQIKRVARERA